MAISEMTGALLMWFHEVYTTTRLRNTNKYTKIDRVWLLNVCIQRKLRQLGNVRNDEANINFSMYLP